MAWMTISSPLSKTRTMVSSKRTVEWLDPQGPLSRLNRAIGHDAVLEGARVNFHAAK